MGWEVGGKFKREGTYAYLWLIHIDVRQKPTQCCKAIICQLKIYKFIFFKCLVGAVFNHIPDYQEFQGLLHSGEMFYVCFASGKQISNEIKKIN